MMVITDEEIELVKNAIIKRNITTESDLQGSTSVSINKLKEILQHLNEIGFISITDNFVGGYTFTINKD